MWEFISNTYCLSTSVLADYIAFTCRVKFDNMSWLCIKTKWWEGRLTRCTDTTFLWSWQNPVLYLLACHGLSFSICYMVAIISLCFTTFHILSLLILSLLYFDCLGINVRTKQIISHYNFSISLLFDLFLFLLLSSVYHVVEPWSAVAPTAVKLWWIDLEWQMNI